jgi:hypothetical protein
MGADGLIVMNSINLKLVLASPNGWIAPKEEPACKLDSMISLRMVEELPSRETTQPVSNIA